MRISTMRTPTLFIIGATKAGTTSLHHYLNQHPEIYMCPSKETNYYAQQSALCLLEETVTSPKEYAALFKDAGDAKVIGETSPAYLCVPDAPRLIAADVPEAKLIAILRNPTERAYSHFLMRRRQGKELRESFAQCIEEEDIDPARSYKSRGFYGEQVERYLKCFPLKQLKLILYEEFLGDPHKVLRDIFAFLGVDPDFKPDMNKQYNKNPPAEPLTGEMRQMLIDLYRADIALLQTLTGLDLSAWLR